MLFSKISATIVAGLALADGVVAKFALTGAQTGIASNGQRPPRKELRELFATTQE